MVGFGDPDIAVGPSYIVQVVNTTINFYTKDGTNTFSQTFSDFFFGTDHAGGGGNARVIYDRETQRWIFVTAEGGNSNNSALLFAVSDDSDPNGIWFRYRIPAYFTFNLINYWVDHPSFGYNKDGYVFSADLYALTTFAFNGTQFFAFPKAPTLTGSPVAVTLFTDTAAGRTQMAKTLDPTKDTVFGASRTAANVTRFYAVRSLATSPTLFHQDFGVASVDPSPPYVDSTGGQQLRTNRSNLLTAIWRNEKLYLSYENRVSLTFAGSHWAVYDTTNWPGSGGITELQVGDVNDAALNQFVPAIGVNKWDDVSLLFTQSSTSVTSNIAVTGRTSTDPANTMSAPVVMKAADTSPYAVREWSDFFGVDVDPVDDETFWGTAMYVGADQWWSTEIMSWTVSQTTNAVPTGATWIRGLAVSGGFANLAANDGSYDVAKAGPVLFAGEAPAQLQVDSVAPSGTILSLDLTVVAKANTVGLAQKVELWNWTTSSWVNVGEQSATTSNSIQSVSGSGTLSDFVQGGTKAVRAKISWRQTGPVLLWPWQVSADQVQWTFRSR